MNKKLVASLFIASGFACTGASAATSENQDLLLQLDVAGACVLGAADKTAVSFPTLETASEGYMDLTYLGQFFTSSDALTVQFEDSYCNAAHLVTLTTANDGMTVDTPVMAGSDAFDDFINYRATLDWNNQFSFNTGGTGGLEFTTTQINGAFRADDVTLVFTIPFPYTGGANPLLAGEYTDQFTLTISLQ